MLTSPAVIWDLSLPAFSFSSFASHRLEPRRQGRLCAGLRVVTAWRPFLPPVTFSTLNDTCLLYTSDAADDWLVV